MRSRHIVWTSVAALGAALTLAGCGGTSTGAATSAAAAGGSAPPAAGSSAKGLHVAHTSLGNILVDGKGMTVYLLTSDKPNDSKCNSSCLALWPLVPSTQTKHASGITAKIGHTASTSGTQMATVGGWPLYTYISDKKPGQVTGEGVASFGGTWYAVSPSGQAVKASGSSSSSSSSGSGGGGYGGY